MCLDLKPMYANPVEGWIKSSLMLCTIPLRWNTWPNGIKLLVLRVRQALKLEILTSIVEDIRVPRKLATAQVVIKRQQYHLDSFRWEIWFYILSRRESNHPTMKSSSTMILYWLEYPQPLSPHPALVCAAQRIPMGQLERSVCSQWSQTWSSQLLGLVTVIQNSILGRWNARENMVRGQTRELVSSFEQIYSCIRIIMCKYYIYQQAQGLTSPDPGSRGHTQSQ